MLCHYTYLLHVMQLNITFAHLRYYIAGYRPSQTNSYCNIALTCYVSYVFREWYFTMAEKLPSILHIGTHTKTQYL